MPSFHHSVAVPLYRCPSSVQQLPLLCHCGWEQKCWKLLSVYIGIKWPERWLVVCLWQNGKK